MATTPIKATPSQSNPFIKQLASSNRTTRDHALSSLRTFLKAPRSTSLTPLDLLKLWKGLFYCMYMSDKPRNQQKLARDLADLIDVLSTPSTKFSFTTAFWATMSREWGGIDSLRMDKYLYLIRCYVRKGFEVCQGTRWDGAVVSKYVENLRTNGGPLSVRDVRVPTGLRLHVLDTWLDELEKVDEEREAPVETIMSPIRNLSKGSLIKSVRERAHETCEDERLLNGKAWRDDVEKEEDADEHEQDAANSEAEGDFAGFDD